MLLLRIEDPLRTRLARLLGGLEDLLLHADDFRDLVDDVDEALPLRHLLEDVLHLPYDLTVQATGGLLAGAGLRAGAGQRLEHAAQLIERPGAQRLQWLDDTLLEQAVRLGRADLVELHLLQGVGDPAADLIELPR